MNFSKDVVAQIFGKSRRCTRRGKAGKSATGQGGNRHEYQHSANDQNVTHIKVFALLLNFVDQKGGGHKGDERFDDRFAHHQKQC